MQYEDAPSISFQTSLPLAWEIPVAPDAATQALWRQDNLALLRALATLESVVTDKERESEQALGKALERMEAKVDIMLSLLARLASRESGLPAPSPLTLAAHRVEWSCPAASLPPTDRQILLKLYLSPKLPEPLRLWVRVATQAVTPGSAACFCVAEFLDEDPEFEEWMTRTLFRYHRRTLQARHHE